MQIFVSVSSVDGETSVSYHGPDLPAARNFLAQNDHEGSGVRLQVIVEDDDVYPVLEKLSADTD